MLASPMYMEEKTVSKKQEETASSSVSVTSVAFISVFCTLAVVAVALVAFKVGSLVFLSVYYTKEKTFSFQVKFTFCSDESWCHGGVKAMFKFIMKSSACRRVS